MDVHGRAGFRLSIRTSATQLETAVEESFESRTVGRLLRLLRPAQFAAIGAFCAVVQLGLLAALTEGTELGSLSNAASFLIAAQLNFGLNSVVTWRDRMHRRPGALLAQLLGFNALILVAVLLNQAIYLVALRAVPYLAAGAIGIGGTTLAKYSIADRWIFRKGRRLLRAVAAPPG
ncbi:MAG: hypothetical protein C0506_13810 [Anaerolinea sp.]|nr:hypothetical protein [Anaerolinea sp.]